LRQYRHRVRKTRAIAIRGEPSRTGNGCGRER
jgi:hypothetical protein